MKTITHTLIALALLAMAGSVSAMEAYDIELLPDPHFQKGVWVRHPDNPPLIVEGPLQYTTAFGDPVWNLGQWRSAQSIWSDHDTPEILASGAKKWENLYKYIILGDITDPEADLVTCVDDIAENQVPRDPEERPWTPLLTSSSLTTKPVVSTLTEVDWNFEAKLVSYLSGGDGFAHYPTHLVIKHVTNPSDHFTLALEPYDDRDTVPGGLSIGYDPPTDNMMYNPGLSNFTNTVMQLGQWKTLRGDLLVHIKNGIKYGYDQGYLDSPDPANYKIENLLQIGWEVENRRVAMQVRNVSYNVGTGSGRKLVTAQPGGLLSSYTGWLGMKVTVGAEPLVVTHLGRWKVPGNVDTHTLKLVNASDGSDVPFGSVDGEMPPDEVGDNGFVYEPLPTPVRLNANTSYYVVSHETTGQDRWYRQADTVVTPTIVYPASVATVAKAVQISDAGAISEFGSANHGFGPVNFRYAKPLVKSQTLGTTLSTTTQWLGMKITVGANPLTVTGLGRMKAAGNNQIHTLKLVNAATVQDVPGGSVDVDMTSVYGGYYAYGTFGTPVTLSANTSYYVVSHEVTGHDQWYKQSNTTVTPTSVATVPKAVQISDAGSVYEIPNSTNHCFGPVTLLYTSPQ